MAARLDDEDPLTRDRDEIVRVARALEAQVIRLTEQGPLAGTVDRLLSRLHDAKRGYATGGSAPMEEIDPNDPESGPSPVQHSDRTGALATSAVDQQRAKKQARDDLAELLREMVRMEAMSNRLEQLIDRNAAVHPTHRCKECWKVGTPTEAYRARWRDRCLFHGHAYVANEGHETPIPITQAHLRGYLTDRIIENNPIQILDENGEPTGRSRPWIRRKKTKGAKAA